MRENMINKIALNIKNGKEVDPNLLYQNERGLEDTSVSSKAYLGANPY